jgi:hypothetical protein
MAIVSNLLSGLKPTAIQNLQVHNDTTTPSGSIIYTVPAGKYAVLTFNYITTDTAFTTTETHFFHTNNLGTTSNRSFAGIFGPSLDALKTRIRLTDNPILHAGEPLRWSSNTSNAKHYSITIFEYDAP